MHLNKTKKLAVLTAAAVALLAVSVSAAVLWLTPAQVADHHNQPLLAEAFDGPDAIEVNETVESGDFAVTLLGERLESSDMVAFPLIWCALAVYTRDALQTLARMRREAATLRAQKRA